MAQNQKQKAFNPIHNEKRGGTKNGHQSNTIRCTL